MHVAVVGLIPAVGMVEKDRVPIGELEPLQVVCMLGTVVQDTVPVHVLDVPNPVGLGEQETVVEVGSVTMKEENGSKAL